MSRTASAHNADILSCSMNEGHSILATSDYRGNIVVWSTDQYAVRTRLRPQDHQFRPETEQGIEGVRFLSGPLRYMLVTVGADRSVTRYSQAVNSVCNRKHGVQCGVETCRGHCLSPHITLNQGVVESASGKCGRLPTFLSLTWLSIAACFSSAYGCQVYLCGLLVDYNLVCSVAQNLA